MRIGGCQITDTNTTEAREAFPRTGDGKYILDAHYFDILVDPIQMLILLAFAFFFYSILVKAFWEYIQEEDIPKESILIPIIALFLGFVFNPISILLLVFFFSLIVGMGYSIGSSIDTYEEGSKTDRILLLVVAVYTIISHILNFLQIEIFSFSLLVKAFLSNSSSSTNQGYPIILLFELGMVCLTIFLLIRFKDHLETIVGSRLEEAFRRQSHNKKNPFDHFNLLWTQTRNVWFGFIVVAYAIFPIFEFMFQLTALVTFLLVSRFAKANSSSQPSSQSSRPPSSSQSRVPTPPRPPSSSQSRVPTPPRPPSLSRSTPPTPGEQLAYIDISLEATRTSLASLREKQRKKEVSDAFARNLLGKFSLTEKRLIRMQERVRREAERADLRRAFEAGGLPRNKEVPKPPATALHTALRSLSESSGNPSQISSDPKEQLVYLCISLEATRASLTILKEKQRKKEVSDAFARNLFGKFSLTEKRLIRMQERVRREAERADLRRAFEAGGLPRNKKVPKPPEPKSEPTAPPLPPKSPTVPPPTPTLPSGAKDESLMMKAAAETQSTSIAKLRAEMLKELRRLRDIFKEE